MATVKELSDQAVNVDTVDGTDEDTSSSSSAHQQQQLQKQQQQQAQQNSKGNEKGKSKSDKTKNLTESQLAALSSLRHTSRAIAHALVSPFPKTKYRVGWDARATAALRWALPDRVLDWGFAALSARERKEREKESADAKRGN
jgi:small-conductance mechanosensitive channel